MLRFGLPLISVLALCSASLFASPQRGGEDELARQWSRYFSQNNPVDKARVLARLAARQMNQIRDYLRADQQEQALAALRQFRDAVMETTSALAEAGIDAARKPKGFKELQMSLRSFLHSLDDVTLSLGQELRPAYESLRGDLEMEENRLMDALFPPRLSKGSAAAHPQ